MGEKRDYLMNYSKIQVNLNPSLSILSNFSMFVFQRAKRNLWRYVKQPRPRVRDSQKSWRVLTEIIIKPMTMAPCRSKSGAKSSAKSYRSRGPKHRRLFHSITITIIPFDPVALRRTPSPRQCRLRQTTMGRSCKQSCHVSIFRIHSWYC